MSDQQNTDQRPDQKGGERKDQTGSQGQMGNDQKQPTARKDHEDEGRGGSNAQGVGKENPGSGQGSKGAEQDRK